VTAADDQELVGCEAFAEEGFMGFSMAADADRVEVAKDGTREGAGVVGGGSRSFWKTARKDGGPPETQRKVACGLILHVNAKLCCILLNMQ
jgi:hypothetical protein